MVLQNKSNQGQILEDVVPLVIETGNMIDVVNSRKEDMDTEELVDNVKEVPVGGDLSPNQIKSLKMKHGKYEKKPK